jgi:hypothetical protein
MSLGPPLWKVRRELGRLSQQLRAVLEFFYEPFLRWQHDRERGTRLKVTPGASAPARKVAVYLVFQPRGLAESSLLTCRHLAAGGYAPLVVSNAPLSEADREQLQAVSWKVVERPNFGYDFGGYRDGIWLLDHWGEKPESLILLNDSIWFPALEGDQTIAKMESMAADFRGILKLGTGEGAVLRRGREPFLGSFFLMFSGKALRSEAFSLFWRQYLNTSNKYKTIRRGERRLSYVMRDAGFEGASLFDRTRFDEYLKTAEPATLRRILGDLVSIDPGMERSIADITNRFDAAQQDGQAAMAVQMRSIIQAATVKSNLFSSIPIMLLREFSIPFIKKSRDHWNIKALQKIAKTMQSVDEVIAIAPSPKREILDLVDQTTRMN